MFTNGLTDFRRFPSTRVLTFVETRSQSAIDHWYVSTDVVVLDCSVVKDSTAQHLPLSIAAEVKILADSNLIPRQANLFFPSERLRFVQLQLEMLNADGLTLDLNQLYSSMEGAFLAYGLVRDVPRCRQVTQQWMNFLPDEMKDHLMDLEQTHQRIVHQVTQTGVAHADHSSFRMVYQVAFSRARRVAEKRIGAHLARKAKGRFACWDLIKKLRNPTQAVAIDAYTISSHFETVFHSTDDPLILNLDQLGLLPPPDFSVVPFTDEELIAALRALNANAATGPQKISSRYLKDVFSSRDSRVSLLLLMNICFDTGQVPKSWGYSEVFILYKGKGLRILPTNYRGINLNNDFLRIYERLLQARFNDWIRETRPWGPMQFGFTPGVSTIDAFLCLQTLTRVFTDVLKVPCYANFLDLKKAFPSINRAATLNALSDMGVPYELIRAFASTFSMNWCSLCINGGLTRNIFVNKGTKEGGINSPSIFNTAYESVLRKLDLKPFPDSLENFNTSAVYYLVFADDLVLLSANLSRLESVTRDLDRELRTLSMEINTDKSKWMMFLPTNPSTVPVASDLRLILNGIDLELVDEFTYLGFTIDCYGNMKTHAKKKTELMMLAARTVGKLFCQLEVSDLRSLRAYYYSLVGSQLYDHSCVTFSGQDVKRAQKIFLQEVFNLPDSFPIELASILLGVQDPQLMVFTARSRFITHLASSQTAVASAQAMLLNRTLLLPRGVGWNHELFAAVPSIPQISSTNLTSPSEIAGLRENLTQAIQEERISTIRTSRAFPHVLEFFPSGAVNSSFGQFLGQIPFESSRIIIIFIGNLSRFSLLSTPDRACPFCNQTLYSSHFFTCTRFPWEFQNALTWQNLVHLFVNRDWRQAASYLFQAFRQWDRITNIFRPGFRDRVTSYFEHLRSMTNGTIMLPIPASSNRRNNSTVTVSLSSLSNSMSIQGS